MKSVADPTSIEAYRARKTAEWIADIARLMETLESWLSPAIEQQLLTIGRTSRLLHEPGLGAYRVDALTIHAGHQEVGVIPRAMRNTHIRENEVIDGVCGRIDLSAGTASKLIVRRSDRSWALVIQREPFDPTHVPLDSATFANALAALLEQ